MKSYRIPTTVLVTICLVVALPVIAATPISMRVNTTTSKDSHEDIKGSNESSHHQTKSVEAVVRNMGQQTVDGLTVKFTAFGRDQKADKQVILKSEEKKIAVEPGKEVTVPFTIAATYTPEHFVSSRSGGGSGKKSRTTTKKVLGEGTRLIGYGVQVLQGTTVLAEDFQPRGLKDDLASTPTAAKTEAKKKTSSQKK